MYSRILTLAVGLSPSFWRQTILTSISAGVAIVALGRIPFSVDRPLLAYVTAWGSRWLQRTGSKLYAPWRVLSPLVGCRQRGGGADLIGGTPEGCPGRRPLA